MDNFNKAATNDYFHHYSIIFLVYLFIYHVVTTQLKTQWHSFSNNIKVANPHIAWKWQKWLIDNQKDQRSDASGAPVDQNDQKLPWTVTCVVSAIDYIKRVLLLKLADDMLVGFI